MCKHTPAPGIPGPSVLTLCREAEQPPTPTPASAEPPLVVTGSRACDAARRERIAATGVGGQVVDGVASERPATASTPVPSVWWAERQRDSSASHPALWLPTAVGSVSHPLLGGAVDALRGDLWSRGG
ncbi:hypothetical protein, conserved [Leishmania lindenbergi]|uniref:Uncharacterized protein n=1 Tax=Leishmania lindenbergi TaxID=651832 RepID=A0AAW3A3A1_9TRYP